MLTRDLAIARYDFQKHRVVPDRLTTREHAHYPLFAERMLQIYRNGIGVCRRDLHRRVQAVFEDETDCPQRRIDAFCKLLDEAAQYANAGRGKIAELRRTVFRRAAVYHPLVSRADQLFEHSAVDVRTTIAEELGRPWQQIEDELFADIIDFHRLESFTGYPTARHLLSRYNVAQVQVALFSAVSMEIQATGDFKRILRAARLSRLMHSISRISDSCYYIRLDGPASVLRETRRYGVQMAKFLPVLISCTGWKMHAVVETRNGWKLGLDLHDTDGLQSHLPDEDEFDSSVEAQFFRSWGNDARDGWMLYREAEFLHAGQKTFVPDFVFRHTNGRTAFLEIVGFWTPEYLQSRLQTHTVFANAPILLAIHESTHHHFQDIVPTGKVIPYKTAISVKAVLDALTGVLI